MTQITISKPSSAQWTATFNNPPINLIDPDTIGELQDLVAALESDAEVKVVVFRSADPDFFLAHWDVLADKAKVAAMPPGPTGLHPWADVLVRLSRAPVASIAEIRGRARGAGSEFVLSCDMRFASRERGILGQFEVGMGAGSSAAPTRNCGLARRWRWWSRPHKRMFRWSEGPASEEGNAHSSSPIWPKLPQACGSDSANANLGIAARRFPCSIAAKSTMAL